MSYLFYSSICNLNIMHFPSSSPTHHFIISSLTLLEVHFVKAPTHTSFSPRKLPNEQLDWKISGRGDHEFRRVHNQEVGSALNIGAKDTSRSSLLSLCKLQQPIGTFL